MNRSTNFNFYLPTNADPMLVSDLTYNFEQIDANALSVYTQSFSESQKTQARTNIGAASEASMNAINAKTVPATVGNTPTYNTGITNTELIIRRIGTLITGHLVFAYASSYSGGDGLQEIITNANGIPPGFNVQMPIICVYGTNAGKVGRVRISTDGKLAFWYSNLLGTAGESYVVPLNYAERIV